MGNKIAPIKKAYSNVINTIDQQLDKHGYARFPGTSETVLPYKELSGKYRTGLDIHAPYLSRLSEESKAAEIEKIKEKKARLEKALGIPNLLEPTSIFWNFAASEQALQAKFGSELRVKPVKLGNDEQFFDISDPMGEITWAWLSVHPRIASSLDAYKRGEHGADTKYYIVDDEKEAKETFDRKKEINKAVIALDDMTPTKRKQIARLIGLPVTESTKEEVVYNLLDSQLKETEFKEGEHKGLAPVRLFLDLIATTDDRIKVKDIVNQALTHSIYRPGTGGKILEGGLTIATSKEELIENLLKDENQMDLIALEKKLQSKKNRAAVILVDSLLYGIDQRLNKLATNTHQEIAVEDKILALNEAQIKLIKTKVSQNNVYKMGLDAFKKRYQDLQFLIENFEDHALDLEAGDKNLHQYKVKVGNLDPKFMFYIDAYLIADKGDCKNRVLACNADLVKHADIQMLLNNNNFKPSFEYQETIVDISSDELHVYTDGTFTPKKLHVSYLRYPGKIDKEGYVYFDGKDSKNQDCELEDYMEDELLDLAVLNLAMYTENIPAATSAQNRTNTNE